VNDCDADAITATAKDEPVDRGGLAGVDCPAAPAAVRSGLAAIGPNARGAVATSAGIRRIETLAEK